MIAKIKTAKFLLLLVAALLIVSGSWYVHSKQKNDAKKAAVASTKQGVPTNQSAADASKGKTTPGAQTNSEPPTATDNLPNAALTIDSFSQSGGLVKASATITNSQPGDCFFGFSSEGTKPVNRTVPSTTQGASQKCDAAINEAEFTKLGKWTLNVVFTVGNSKVESSKDVTIN
jgi:hypothetical protein